VLLTGACISSPRVAAMQHHSRHFIGSNNKKAARFTLSGLIFYRCLISKDSIEYCQS
jgi:hypothetical protein